MLVYISRYTYTFAYPGFVELGVFGAFNLFGNPLRLVGWVKGMV